MSKLLYACFYHSKPKEFSVDNLNSLSRRLEPDNITFRDTEIVSNEKEVIAIFNPNDSIKIEGKSVCMGNMLNPASDWSEPKSLIPDGTYALFRGNTNTLEVISDMVGTRTVWYYHDENVFISATSQRAIIFFFQSFEFDKRVLPWMLATGTLGPGFSWDRRIKMLDGDSILTLNRNTWELDIETNNVEFIPVSKANQDHYKELKVSLIDTFNSLDLNFNNWILPLSGGYDSRAILCFLKDQENLKCVTWGLESSKSEKGNDALIAKELANYFEKEHKYYLTDLSEEPIENIFNRFLHCGEGRVGDIDAYLDGFSIWKELMESGVHGIIRGDEGFGAGSVMSGSNVRHNMRFPLFSDFANFTEIHKLGIPEQEFPNWLNRKDDESLEAWRDRVYYKYEMPIVFAALNDLKLSFVEVINPLLTRKTLAIVTKLPDYLRTNKKLFKAIVNELGPNIDFAINDATAERKNICKDQNVVNEILSELKKEQASLILPPEFIEFLLNHMEPAKRNSKPSRTGLKERLKRLLPKKIKNLLRSSIISYKLDYNIIAFRAYIILKMNRLLKDDATICS